ncbi:MAG: DUF4129 domain-containing protein [Firmicutes bacterium]|nr:DUF4129 domain-containing protein [Bacillota bacterium]
MSSRSGKPFGVTDALVLAMEMALWYAWEIVIFSAVGLDAYVEKPVLWVQALAITAGSLVTENLYQRKVSLGYLRAGIGVSGLVSTAALAAILAPAPGDAFTTSLIILLFLWWRGAVVVQYYRNHGALSEQFASLTLRLILLLILSPMMGLPSDSTGRLVLCMASFFVAGLLALAGTSMSAIILQAEEVGQPGPPHGKAWRRIAIIAALGVVVVPTAAGWLLAGRDVVGAAAVVRRFLLWIAGVLLGIVLPIAVIVGRVIEPLMRWIARRPARLPPIGVTISFADQLKEETLRSLPPWLVGLVFALGILFVAYVMLSIFMSSIWLRLEPEEEGVLETRESIWSWAELPWLAAGHQTCEPGSCGEPADGGDPSRVRTAYRRLLGLGAKVNAGRRSSETPYEYLPRFLAAAPAPRGAVEFLTNLYIRVRYGAYTVEAGEYEELDRCLAEIVRSVNRIGNNRV